jgi:hypothetical protein
VKFGGYLDLAGDNRHFGLQTKIAIKKKQRAADQLKF